MTGLVGMVLAALVAAGCTAAGPDPVAGPEGSGSGPTVAGCPSDLDPSIPDTAPVGVAWEPLSDEVPVVLPVSDRYGPCRRTATVAAGYARTPRGAVIAATQILARAQVPGDVGRDTIDAQVVPGPWRETLRDSLDAVDTSAPATVAFAGFSVAAADRDTARVALAVRVDQLPGQLLLFAVDLVWRNGDWRAHPPPGGDWRHAVSVVTGLPTRFVRWGAGNG